MIWLAPRHGRDRLGGELAAVLAGQRGHSGNRQGAMKFRREGRVRGRSAIRARIRDLFQSGVPDDHTATFEG